MRYRLCRCLVFVIFFLVHTIYQHNSVDRNKQSIAFYILNFHTCDANVIKIVILYEKMIRKTHKFDLVASIRVVDSIKIHRSAEGMRTTRVKRSFSAY